MVVLGGPLSSKMRTDGNFRVRVLNRYIGVHPIGLRRVFSRGVNISTRIFDDNMLFPGLHGGAV